MINKTIWKRLTEGKSPTEVMQYARRRLKARDGLVGAGDCRLRRELWDKTTREIAAMHGIEMPEDKYKARGLVGRINKELRNIGMAQVTGGRWWPKGMVVEIMRRRYARVSGKVDMAREIIEIVPK